MTLQQKIRDLLQRLAMLSDAPAGNLEAHLSKSAPESSAPSGSERFPGTADEIRERSLYDWYLRAFAARAGEPDRLLSLYLAGECEYLRRTDPAVHARTAEKGSIFSHSEDGAAVEGIAAKHVIDEFSGVHALDVAIIEGKTEAWVLKVRRLHGRDPQDGRDRAPFIGWDDDERNRQIRLLLDQAKHRGEILGAKAIAKHFGVAKNTVRPYLEPVSAAA